MLNISLIIKINNSFPPNLKYISGFICNFFFNSSVHCVIISPDNRILIIFIFFFIFTRFHNLPCNCFDHFCCSKSHTDDADLWLLLALAMFFLLASFKSHMFSWMKMNISFVAWWSLHALFWGTLCLQ